MRKHRRSLLYGLIAVIILCITVFFTRKSSENWTYTNYGTTNSDHLEIRDGDVIRTTFVIPENHFQGIQIKMISTAQTFGNEKLHFYMKDDETDQLAAEYVLELNKAFNQSGIFVSLPMEDSAGKEVTVSIVGEDIGSTVPELYISKNCGLESSLSVNGVSQSGFYLVFAAFFLETRSVNPDAALAGAMALLLLLCGYLWPSLMRRGERNAKNAGVQENRAGSGPPELVYENQPAGYGNRKKELTSEAASRPRERRLSFTRKNAALFLVLSFVYACLAVFAYKNNVEPQTEDKRHVQVVEAPSQEEASLQIRLTGSDSSLRQTFTASRKELSSAYYSVKVENSSPGARVRVQVYDGNLDICYSDRSYALDDLPEEGDCYLFFDREYENSSGEQVNILFTPEHFGDAVLVFSGSGDVSQSQTWKNKQRLSVSPVLTVNYSDHDYLLTCFKIFSVLVFIFFVLCYVLIIWMRLKIQTWFIPVTLCLGLLYMLIIPVYSVPDEYSHMDTAYILSNRMLGIDYVPGMHGYEYKRSCDIETEEFLTYNADLADYRRLYTEWLMPAGDTTLELCCMKDVSSNANMLCYLPAAIGITLGRLLGAGTLTMYLMGRLCSLLAYTLLMYLAIRKMPYLTSILFLCVTLPVVLQEAASLAYDSMVNAFSFLFLVYCMAAASEPSSKAERGRDGFVLLFCLTQICSVKGGAYLPMGLFILIIPVIRKWRAKDGLIFTVYAGLLAVGAFLQNNASRLLINYVMPSQTRVNVFSGSQLYTLSYLIHHPLKMVLLYVNTFFTEGSRIIYEIFGGKMGSLSDIQMPWMYVLIFMAVLLAFMITEGRGAAVLSGRPVRIIGGVSVLFTVLALSLAMLLADTNINRNYIVGLQGRYYLPCFLCLTALLAGRIGETGRTFDRRHVTVLYLFTQVVFLLNIVMVVFPNQ